MRARFIFVPIIFLVALAAPSTAIVDGVYLRTNQVGYRPGEQKVALALTNQNLKGQSFRVIKNPGGTILFSSVVGKDRGNYGNFSHLYELDFTPMNAEGRYSISISNNTSYPFHIGSNVYASLVPKSLTFFRVQRCGNTTPLKHSVCHLKDGFASGGWHDAGDYLKFVITTAASLNLMLTAYDRHPSSYVDGNHNGKPDVLDESQIGLDWIYKMWDASHKKLFFQVGDESDHQGWRMPDQDDKNGVTRKIYSCDAGKGANVSGKAAAALALASLIWNDPQNSFYDKSLADKYLVAAEEIYNFGKKRQAVQPGKPFYTENSWHDDIALAAIELYRATRKTGYLNDARKFGKAAKNGWTVDWSNMHSLAHYEIARTDSSYRQTAIAFLKRDLDAYKNHADHNPFRVALPSFYWGSASALVGQTLEMHWYEDLSGDASYRNLAQQQRDYILGANPWGVSWINSAGQNWSRHPHHQITDLTRTQLVGFWNEGPDTKSDWMQYQIQLRKPDPYAAFQSDAAVYHDDVADYVTNEPTIFANGLGVALLSWYQQ